MWYFSWILGLGLALTFGVLNAMWFEFTMEEQAARPPPLGPDREAILDARTSHDALPSSRSSSASVSSEGAGPGNRREGAMSQPRS